MVEKCKREAANQQMKNKEEKMRAIGKLKGLSVMGEKGRVRRLAQEIVGEGVDLEEVFRDTEKKKDKEL